jgi:aspartate/methionine/tyrosine aminotransferase
MFSTRVPRELTPNRLSLAVRDRVREGRPPIDLTVTNPTTVGIEYPSDLLASLASGASLRYRPEPFGLSMARRAIANGYQRRGISVAEDRVVLTASTSEAYSILFKLLCAPAGDDVLVPVPSYPLFEHLTRLDGVAPRSYELHFHGRWELDESSVDAAWTHATRAVLAVSPNNPTGSILSDHELDALSQRCAERDAALILDEVFADYVFGDQGRQLVSPVSHNPPRTLYPSPLKFRLGGLSKSVGLPQVKLGWIVVDGPDDLVREALERLELICDTYLSVSTPVQLAAPALLAKGEAVRGRIQERIRLNLETMRRMAGSNPAVELLRADGGWSAVLRVPSRESEEELVLGLLERRGTLVHPGFFFDFPREAFVVVSLLPAPATFAEGMGRILEHVGG